MTSKQTTLAGVFAFATLLFGALSAQFDGDPETIANWNAVVAGAGVLIGFWQSRDNKVSDEKAGAR